jgi:hypothetical protein
LARCGKTTLKVVSAAGATLRGGVWPKCSCAVGPAGGGSFPGGGEQDFPDRSCPAGAALTPLDSALRESGAGEEGRRSLRDRSVVHHDRRPRSVWCSFFFFLFPFLRFFFSCARMCLFGVCLCGIAWMACAPQWLFPRRTVDQVVVVKWTKRHVRTWAKEVLRFSDSDAELAAVVLSVAVPVELRQSCSKVWLRSTSTLVWLVRPLAAK